MVTKLIKNTPYVVDSSVILKAFLLEDDRDLAVRLMDLHQNKKITLMAPSILFYEIGNTLAKRYPTPEALEKIIKEYLKLDIGIIPLDYLGMQSVAKLVQKYPKISYYDAAFHVLAKEINAHFITADKKYYDTVKEEGFIYHYDEIEI